MQIKQVSFGNNNVVASSDSSKNKVGLASTAPFENDKDVFSKNKKDHGTLKYVLIGAGIIATAIAIINHKKIGEFFNKLFNKDSVSNSGASSKRIADILSGKASSEELAAAAKKANAKAHEIAAMRQNFPELLANREERRIKFLKNKEKFKNNIFDLDYYKDDFRVNITVPAERLKILRESDNPKLKEMFDIDRKMFQPEDGIMIYGNNESEKKKLLESFISEAQKYDIDVINLKAGDSDPLELTQKIAKLFPEAKQKFLTQKRQTIFVMEDMDKMLNIKDETLFTLNVPCRGTINEHTNNCHNDGIMWISTVKDISKLDGSCYRGGRVTNTINIDDAIKLTKKPNSRSIVY